MFFPHRVESAPLHGVVCACQAPVMNKERTLKLDPTRGWGRRRRLVARVPQEGRRLEIAMNPMRPSKYGASQT
jgi:hypothetical protein